MGRSVSVAGGGSGGAGSAVMTAYTPTRLYGPPGAAGTPGAALNNALTTCPFMLRPGFHLLTGLWAAISTAGDNCRLGLWADNGSGAPGELLKDCGLSPVVPQGLLKAAFTPFVLDGGSTGRMLHIGAVVGTAKIITARPSTGVDPGSSAGQPLADIGLPNGLIPFQYNGLFVDVAMTKADVPPTAALTSNPPVIAATSIGFLVAGLIFG